MPAPRLDRPEAGPATVGLPVIATAALWALARPPGQPAASYAGQLLGAESVLLLWVGLVLISTLP